MPEPALPCRVPVAVASLGCQGRRLGTSMCRMGHATAESTGDREGGQSGNNMRWAGGRGGDARSAVCGLVAKPMVVPPKPAPAGFCYTLEWQVSSTLLMPSALPPSFLHGCHGCCTAARSPASIETYGSSECLQEPSPQSMPQGTPARMKGSAAVPLSRWRPYKPSR